MSHTHTGPSDWPVIARMLKAGYSGVEIARTLGKDPSTVNRHVAANGGRNGYDVREVRRKKRWLRIAAMDGIRVMKGALLRTVTARLKKHESPEQIAGVLKTVSASTIYRYIKERAPHLKQFLRSKKGKYRRKRGTKIREKKRAQAKKRRIGERPKIVERRGRLGDWERLEKKSGLTVYFAYPYHFWERGTNESTNGLLRQCFPKSYDFNLITAEELARVVRRLNDRPRKRLGFKSPRQLFLKK